MKGHVFSFSSFPSILFSRPFRYLVSDVVMIMTLQVKSPLPPCRGGLGWGALGEARRSKKSVDRVRALDPPTLILPHKGEEIRSSEADGSVRWAKQKKAVPDRRSPFMGVCSDKVSSL